MSDLRIAALRWIRDNGGTVEETGMPRHLHDEAMIAFKVGQVDSFWPLDGGKFFSLTPSGKAILQSADTADGPLLFAEMTP